MNNDYECPRCHNIFPISNKIMHDARCTEQKPLPLDESRKNINGKEEKEEIVPQEKKEEINIPKQEIKKPPSGEFPEVFECDVCHQVFMESERNDHMLCHKLEKEQNVLEVSPEEIERQKEKIIGLMENTMKHDGMAYSYIKEIYSLRDLLNNASSNTQNNNTKTKNIINKKYKK